MIRHIVCFKLHEDSVQARERAAEVLRSMEGKVPQLRGIEVGCDFLRSPRSYDVILQVLLDDADALDAYQNDAYHCSVVKTHMHAAAASSIALDYEI